MTAPDHTIKSFKNFLRERGHPYMPHFSCFLPAGDFVAGIEPHASKVNVDAWARRQNYGRGTRWGSLGNFGRRAGNRLLSRMRRAIATTA
jgi:hypothetical protein